MRDTFLIPNITLFLLLWLLSLALFYYIIKAAVRNGVQQVNARLVESVREIEKAVHEIKKAKE
jgi:multisubunit Na+/H+ antiporter MnhG subunit